MTIKSIVKKKPDQAISTPAYNEHRAKILYDATIQFCAQQGRKKIIGAEEYKTLFYSFVNEIDNKTKKLISSHLARNRATPRSIAYYMAMESIEIAAPFLLMSQVFWERDIMQMMDKLSNSHLLIIARRSDITPKIASTLIARGDNLINQVLSKNPTLRLNQVAQGNNVVPSYQYSENNSTEESAVNELPAELSKQPVNELLELAQLALTGKSKPGKISDKHPNGDQDSVAIKMLSHANDNNFEMVAYELADHIGMDIDQVKKIVHHENCESLILFLKGIEFTQNEVSQLLVKLNPAVAGNVSLLNRYIGQYENFSGSQCRDVMRNLGAKSLISSKTEQPSVSESTLLNNAVSVRQRQIAKSHGPALFGTERRSA